MSQLPLTVPVPQRGGIIVARDVSGRVLRITGHPEADRVVLSVWQGARCVATIRLAPADVAEVTAALVRAAVPDPAPQRAEPPGRDRPATVTPLRPGPVTGAEPAHNGSATDSFEAIGAGTAELLRRGWRRILRALESRSPGGPRA